MEVVDRNSRKKEMRRRREWGKKGKGKGRKVGEGKVR